MSEPVVHCSSCNALIRWAISTKSGKLMPIDATPVALGTILLTERDGQTWATVLSKTTALSAASQAGRAAPLFISHFATCPNAVSHRRKP